MTVYEFYTSYVLTGKAVFLSTNLSPLSVSTHGANLRLDYKIFLLSDPIFVEASTLTGVISIPVPVPDDLPF